jgi:branched-chain amino acid transport system ATP-binding protein
VAAGAVVLELDGVDAFYGRIQALRGVTFHIDAGEIVALIGSNGAGKTTTLRTISGLMHPANGSIRLEGAEISRTPAHEIVRRGVCHAPEGRRVFARMQVIDNLQMGAYARSDGDIGTDLERVYKLFPRLRERATQLAGTLSGGEQQMLAIGRALMARPKVLMLDEPSLGLAPILVELIFTIIKDINASGVPILLVEQNASKALELAHRGYVLETGNIVTQGSGAELLRSPEVQRAYLGL